MSGGRILCQHLSPVPGERCLSDAFVPIFPMKISKGGLPPELP